MSLDGQSRCEAILLGIWRELFDTDLIGANDDFFELGGDSLLAIRVAVRARERLEVDLPLSAIFEAPTVENLAHVVSRLRGRRSSTLPPIPLPVSEKGGDQIQLSFAQLNVIERAVRRFGSVRARPPHNIRICVELSGSLDVPALESALGNVLRRHEALRTSVAFNGGTPSAVAVEIDGIELHRHRIQSEQLAIVLQGLAAQPFDLSCPPFIRAHLIQLESEKHVLLVLLDHFAGDAWSIAVLRNEVALGYDAYRRGVEPILPALPIQYSDWARWERDAVQGAGLEPSLCYWRQQLAGTTTSPELSLGTASERLERNDTAATLGFEVFPDVVTGLDELARAEGVALYAVALAVTMAVLANRTGKSDIGVRVPVANRRWTDTENLIGCFANIVVIRAHVSHGARFVDHLHDIHQIVLDAQEHSALPESLLTATLSPESAQSTLLPPHVFFDLSSVESPFALGDLRTIPLSVPAVDAKFVSTSIWLKRGLNGLQGTLLYRTAELDERDAAAFLEEITHAFRRTVVAPRSTLADIVGKRGFAASPGPRWQARR